MSRLLSSLLILTAATTMAAAEPNRKGLDFFEAKIRPVLVTHCYECHSTAAAAKKKLQGGLLLDSRDGSRKGGESGPAIVPGNPGESLLVSALKQDAFDMPPKGRLPDEIIGHFVKWIEMGAPDPRDGSAVVATSVIDLEAGRRHWAFQPLGQVSPPAVQDSSWVRTPIDRFVRDRQETAGVTPNSIADAPILIRRAYFDLIGLPPPTEEVERFIQDFDIDPAAAYERLVDRLLSSDHYGERWARHWLDVTRFAESNGYAFDGDRPHAWRYRDFVIRSLNSDMPYDRFVRLQIAGDLLTDLDVQTTEAAQAAVGTIAATGFLVAGPYTTQQTQKERERSRYEQLDDIVHTLGTSLLGLTVGCSRCHSHKFDPLPQFDYYRLASCFSDVGFSNTGINRQPEAFRKKKSEHDAAHAPLVAVRTKFEQERLPALFEQWLARRNENAAALSAALRLEAWQHIGPFEAESFEMAFERVFDPERHVGFAATAENGTLQWTSRPEWADGTVHNAFKGNNAANYIFRVIESPEDQSISLSLGSNDALKVWVNGKEVLAKFVERAAAAAQERVTVPIQQGRNELMMKIVNSGGPSGFYFAAASLKPQPLPKIGAWHHVGPFPAGNHAAAFKRVFPPEWDTNLERTFQGGKLKWTAQPTWNDGQAHNDKLTGSNCANYLFRVIDADEPQVLSLSLGSDDGIKLWVNGRSQLSKKVARDTAKAGQEHVTIQLAPGRNELLMKIVNSGGKTGFYFAASAGATPTDVAAVLDTNAEEQDQDQEQKAVDWYKGFDAAWLRLNHSVARSKIREPEPSLTHVFAVQVRGKTYQFGEDTFKVYHLRRGNVDNKQDVATPGFLQVLMRTDQQEQHWLDDPADEEKPRPGRLGLADWLSDVERGSGQLLARVIVNRLWHHHFGRGIVATPSDFGTRGERPSHPKLLDWLAGELIRNGWRLKPIHRLIMTSATYMQAADATQSGRRHDPENLLLWRRNSRRLEAEIIRDTLLAVSGTLDSRPYGKGTLDPQSVRRSVYFTVKRSQLIRMLQLFDAPDTMQAIGSREESTVAPQALTLLNSPFIRDLAKTFSARVRPNTETSIEAAITRAYRIALSRPASDEEEATMADFIKQQTQSRGADPQAEALALRDFCHLILCMNEFVYVD